MAQFDPNNYAPVEQRVAEFYAHYPEGSIRTFVASADDKSIMFEARCYRSLDEARDGIYTSGFAQEIQGSGPVNRTNHVENAETSAVGRALANLGYSGSINGKKAPRPSREEMEQAEERRRVMEHQAAEHKAALEFIKGVGARCEDDVTLLMDGKTLPLKSAVRDGWKTMQRERRAALEFARAIEESTGERFAST
jgi:hypothetical protein